MLVYVHKNFNTENQEITKTGFQAGPRYQNQKCDWSGLMCVHTRDMCWGALIAMGIQAYCISLNQFLGRHMSMFLCFIKAFL